MSLRIHGNRLVKTLSGQATRPTAARVRQAVFNIWQGRLQGCRWLDLCTGSGSMGAEALCRGAAVVIGIESTPAACTVIGQNWHPLAGDGQTVQVLRGDVVKRLPTLAGQSFDLIYFDPPYASDLYEPVMRLIVQHHLLAPAGELAVEHGLADWTVNVPELTVCRQKRYGNTGLTFYRVTNDG